MPYPDDFREDAQGSPYANETRHALVENDRAELESFITKLRGLQSDGIVLMGNLNYGKEYLGLQSILEDIPAIVDSIQDDINDSLITE